MNIQRIFLLSILPISLLAACDGGGTSNSGGSDTGGGNSGGGNSGGGGSMMTSSGGSNSGGGGSMMTSSGGAGGSGGSMMTSSGGAGGAGMGACTNAEDQAILTDPSKDVPAAVSDCGQMNFGQEPATYDCIKMLGMTDACTQCFDDTVQCVIMNCLNQCIGGPDSQECADCRAQFCDPAFAECSGLTP